MTLSKKRTLMISLLMATSFSQVGQGMEEGGNPGSYGHHGSAGKKWSFSTVTKTFMCGVALLKTDVNSAFSLVLGPQFRVNQNPLSSGVPIATAGLNNGNIAIAWLDNSNNVVTRIVTPNGTAITNESSVSSSPVSPAIYPFVTGCNNHFAVTWGDGPIFARIFSTNGTAVTSPFTVNQSAYTSMGNPNIGCLTNGNFPIVWAVSSVGNYRIPMRIFSPTGTAITSELNVNQVTTNSQSNPVALGLSNGDLFVNWYSPLSGNYRTVGRFFLSSGTAKANEFTINQNTITPTGGGISAQLTNGNIITIYSNGIANVLGRVIQNEVPVGNAFQVPNNTVTQISGSSIASLTNTGTALTILFDGSIEGRVFDPSGVALTNQFTIPNSSLNAQSAGSVAALSDGNGFVSWLDTGYNIIYGRTVSLINITDSPTGTPTTGTTASPTRSPTQTPTTGTTASPTAAPSATGAPTRSPTQAPTTSSASRLTPGWVSFLPTRVIPTVFDAVVKAFFK